MSRTISRSCQKSQQVNIFVNNYALEHAVEEQAEARHTAVLGLIYSEANMHIRTPKAHTDAVRTNRLGEHGRSWWHSSTPR